MALGYTKSLYLLAFDQGGSFERDLFGASPPIPHSIPTAITDAKEVIYEAFGEATGRGVPLDAAGILVDEQYGATVARKAGGADYLLAMPVEKSGQAEFDFEYGAEFARHIDEFDPTVREGACSGTADPCRAAMRSGEPGARSVGGSPRRRRRGYNADGQVRPDTDRELQADLGRGGQGGWGQR